MYNILLIAYLFVIFSFANPPPTLYLLPPALPIRVPWEQDSAGGGEGGGVQKEPGKVELAEDLRGLVAHM